MERIKYLFLVKIDCSFIGGDQKSVVEPVFADTEEIAKALIINNINKTREANTALFSCGTAIDFSAVSYFRVDVLGVLDTVYPGNKKYVDLAEDFSHVVEKEFVGSNE